nr:hypothetical protein [Tanacetum cinerariifolium]
ARARCARRAGRSENPECGAGAGRARWGRAWASRGKNHLQRSGVAASFEAWGSGSRTAAAELAASFVAYDALLSPAFGTAAA